MSDDLYGDLRTSAGGSMNLDDDESVSFGDFGDFDNLGDLDDDPRPLDDRPKTRRRGRGGTGLLGLTAGQRFVLAFMVLVLSLIFSSACLLVTGRIVV